jgi:hypothetical protein
VFLAEAETATSATSEDESVPDSDSEIAADDEEGDYEHAQPQQPAAADGELNAAADNEGLEENSDEGQIEVN